MLRLCGAWAVASLFVVFFAAQGVSSASINFVNRNEDVEFQLTSSDVSLSRAVNLGSATNLFSCVTYYFDDIKHLSSTGSQLVRSMSTIVTDAVLGVQKCGNDFNCNVGVLVEAFSKLVKEYSHILAFVNDFKLTASELLTCTRYGIPTPAPPTTIPPTTPPPTTAKPTTPVPTTPAPTTPKPTTPAPTTPVPTTPAPTTHKPTTPKPTTPAPTTHKPTTPKPTTPAPTTHKPTTPAPTTHKPTTPAPTTPAPTTLAPTTPKFTTPKPTTLAPTTHKPTTPAPTTPAPTIPAPTTPAPKIPEPKPETADSYTDEPQSSEDQQLPEEAETTPNNFAQNYVPKFVNNAYQKAKESVLKAQQWGSEIISKWRN